MKKPGDRYVARMPQIKQTIRTMTGAQQSALYLTTVTLAVLQLLQVTTSPQYLLPLAANAQQVASFPGVTRDLASFCSARPSLSIDLAPMIVHVKRNTSFNYKLYLFSNTEHVFQTGQVVPRDDFRIHSFPVKLKQLDEFIQTKSLEIYQAATSGGAGQQHLVRVPNSSFDARQFFALVPVNEHDDDEHQFERPNKRGQRSTSGARQGASQKVVQADKRRQMTFDVFSSGDALPGDESFAHHDVSSVAPQPNVAAAAAAAAKPQNANEHIQFDRDDQLVLLGAPVNRLARELASRESAPLDVAEQLLTRKQRHQHQQLMVMPVGSFSSFHVNSTYFVRKDFDQSQAQLVRVLVDAQRFQVNQVHLLRGFGTAPSANKTAAVEPQPAPNNSEEYAFLSHKLLRDADTRITSITQIYEDWITRNFYTVVYIQRRAAAMTKDESDKGNGARKDDETTDRLIFRGSSTVLLGADHLDYYVKASAFVTEKNGLHYYLEFLPSGKFHLGAIDWTKRPFRFLDARGLPIKPTRTLFDNEELLLCPPSVCYSDQPVDELVSYGRLALSDKLQRDARILSRSSTSSSHHADQQAGGKRVLTLLTRPLEKIADDLADEDHELLFVSSPKSSPGDDRSLASPQNARQTSTTTPVEIDDERTTTSHQSESISLDSIITAIRTQASGLTTRLHLRDWVWSLPRVARPPVKSNSSSSGNKFAWHFEWAKRNEVKVTQDTYGFALTGHEIDASYRVFNELYLISANQLITINYTLPNETVTSVHPIEEEFPGLSSSLLDPITGAFYDRYSNQIYFFKGDRYVGFDYATKKPLDDFSLPSGADLLGAGMPAASSSSSGTTTTRLPASLMAMALGVKGRPLVSSLPVVGILGRQHQVDAIYHDLQDDLVYVFSGMKFYTHQASDFKEGAFRSVTRAESGPLGQPPMRCINEHFLDGCRFDEAYPNPCTSEPVDVDMVHSTGGTGKTSARLIDPSAALEARRQPAANASQSGGDSGNNFSDEQQAKLRSIAARGGSGRLFDFLLENTLIAQGATRAIEPFLAASGGGSGATTPSAPREGSYVMLTQSTSSAQERIVIYLLIAMVLITIMVTVAMIIVILNWSRSERASDSSESVAKSQDQSSSPGGQAHLLEERIAYPPAISQYLTNQYHQQRLQQQQQQRHHRSTRDQYHGPRRSVTQMPLPSPPPPTGPKPAARIPFRSYITSGGSELGPLGLHDPDEIIDSSAL